MCMFVCFKIIFGRGGLKNYLMYIEWKYFYIGIICYEYVCIEFKFNMCINFFLFFINILYL